jgi:hypothetical protein
VSSAAPTQRRARVDAINTFGVSAGCVTSLRVVSRSQIQYFPRSHRFWAWFDSRQLHQGKLVNAKSLGQLFFCVKIVPLVGVRPERLGGPYLRERHRPLVEGVNRLSFKNPGMAGAPDRRRVG